jgi:hypothetical protein
MLTDTIRIACHWCIVLPTQARCCCLSKLSYELSVPSALCPADPRTLATTLHRSRNQRMVARVDLVEIYYTHKCCLPLLYIYIVCITSKYKRSMHADNSCTRLWLPSAARLQSRTLVCISSGSTPRLQTFILKLSKNCTTIHQTVLRRGATHMSKHTPDAHGRRQHPGSRRHRSSTKYIQQLQLSDATSAPPECISSGGSPQAPDIHDKLQNLKEYAAKL